MNVNWSCDVVIKRTSWLVNVTFDWHQVKTFQCHLFFTIYTKLAQFIHRNSLKIKCKLKSYFLIFIRWWSQWSLLKLYKKQFRLHEILALPTSFITWWTSKSQILILNWGPQIKWLLHNITMEYNFTLKKSMHTLPHTHSFVKVSLPSFQQVFSHINL